MTTGRSAAPVMGSVRWLLLSILSWEVVQLLRGVGPANTGSLPINPFELLLLFVMPGIAAIAFVRLYLAVVQSAYGSLNTYRLTSSPWAWAFWLGLAIAMVGQGEHVTAHALHQAAPDLIQHGEFGAKMAFFDEELGQWLLGLGFFFMTAVIVVLGAGATSRAIGGERLMLALGSVATFGFAVIFAGVDGQQLVPAIIGSALLTVAGLWVLPPYEISHDPVGLLVIPGVSLAGFVLLIWGLIVGGQPTWPW